MTNLIETKGATSSQVATKLSREMAAQFTNALALVEACFYLYNAGYSLGITDKIDDEAIYNMAEEVKSKTVEATLVTEGE